MNLSILNYLPTGLVIKWMYVIGMAIYSIYSLVILKQAKVMSETIDGKYNSGVHAFAWLNLIAAIILMVSAAIFL